MTVWATWLADVLRDAGLRISPVPGWETRGYDGHGLSGIVGTVHHHTAGPGPERGNMPSLRTLLVGTTVPPPLANIGTGRDGTIYVVAAGLCNHAGRSAWAGRTGLNAWYLGNEYENSGHTDDVPTEAQIDAGARAAAAVMHFLHLSNVVDANPFHKECAVPHGRKPDAWWNADDVRARITGYLSGAVAPPPPVPKTEPSGRPTLRRGATGQLVRDWQAFVGVTADGQFGPRTEAAVRAWQRAHGLLADGIIGPKTWAAWDAAHAAPPPAAPAPQPVPEPGVPTFPGETQIGSRGSAVAQVQARLKARGWNVTVDGAFGPKTRDVVQAFQREKGLRPDGIVGPRTWLALWASPIT